MTTPMGRENQQTHGQETRHELQEAINATTCTTPHIDFTEDEFNEDLIYVEDDFDKAFEEVLQKANLLFRENEGETSTRSGAEAPQEKREPKSLQTPEKSIMIPKRYSKMYPAIKHNEYFEVRDDC